MPPRGPICRGPICRGPICRGPICRGPICHQQNFWGPICRGPICRGPICHQLNFRGPICRQGAQSAGPDLPGPNLPPRGQFAGAQFAKKWQIGPQKLRGPICRQIGEGPNLPGPNLPGPNLPRTVHHFFSSSVHLFMELSVSQFIISSSIDRQ